MKSIDHSARIIGLFDKIRVMNAELLNDFTVKKFQAAVRDRSTIISEIQYEVDAEKSEALNNQSEGRLHDEIEECLKEVYEMDQKVMEFVQIKMDEIRHELKGLTKSAPAALAYSYQKRQ